MRKYFFIRTMLHIFVTTTTINIQKNMDASIIKYLEQCEVVQDDRYFGWSLVDEEGSTIADYDGNWDKTTTYEMFPNDELVEIEGDLEELVIEHLMKGNENAPKEFKESLKPLFRNLI